MIAVEDAEGDAAAAVADDEIDGDSAFGARFTRSASRVDTTAARNPDRGSASQLSFSFTNSRVKLKMTHEGLQYACIVLAKGSPTKKVGESGKAPKQSFLATSCRNANNNLKGFALSIE